MDEHFERALLQKLYSLEKLSLRLLDKIQKTEMENLKLLGEIHSRINDIEREAEERCSERRDQVRDKVNDLRELLYASEGDASKTRESFSMGLGNKFKDIYSKIDDVYDEINQKSTKLAVLETRVTSHLSQENSRFGRAATIASMIISILALTGATIFGIIQALS